MDMNFASSTLPPHLIELARQVHVKRDAHLAMIREGKAYMDYVAEHTPRPDPSDPVRTVTGLGAVVGMIESGNRVADKMRAARNAFLDAGEALATAVLEAAEQPRLAVETAGSCGCDRCTCETPTDTAFGHLDRLKAELTRASLMRHATEVAFQAANRARDDAIEQFDEARASYAVAFKDAVGDMVSDALTGTPHSNSLGGLLVAVRLPV